MPALRGDIPESQQYRQLQTPEFIPGGAGVRASGLGPLPGDYMIDALHRVLGELGCPQLPFLPELPARGWRGSTLARTLATCAGINVDGASFGWRLQHGSGISREYGAARDTYSSDINALADVIGTLNNRGDGAAAGRELKIQLLGPYTLAASVYLPGGQLALTDPGAVRYLYESLLEGIPGALASVIRVLDSPAASVTVELVETELGRIGAGTIPTVSGLHRIRAIPAHEILAGLRRYVQHLGEYRTPVVINILGLDTAHRSDNGITPRTLASAVAHEKKPALLLTPPGPTPVSGAVEPDPRAWEPVAELIDAAVPVWLPLVNSAPVSVQVRNLWSLWRQLGLTSEHLNTVTLTEAPGQLDTLARATARMGRTVEVARALAEYAAEK